jgi:hypothetical protein
VRARRTLAAIAVLSAAAAVLVPLTTRTARGDAFGFKGKAEVKTLEIAYLPASKSLKLRAQLTGAGGTASYQTTDADTIDRVLELASLKSQGARLGVELEGGEIAAFHVVVGGGSATAKE